MAKRKKKAETQAGRGRPRRKQTTIAGLPTFASVIGTRLRELREAKKLSVYDLADASGVSKVAIYDIEGGRCNPQLETLLILDGALDAEGEFVKFAIQTRRKA